jgi:hydroxymethylglutaryl-CoA lyase
MQEHLELVECPRDAMQGWAYFIPTDQKISYLNTLLGVGFDVLDCGSFVSPKAIPQMRDTAEVLAQLDMSATKTKLLVIVANQRGAEEAVAFEQVSYLGFPLSLSETFQQRNTNKSIADALRDVEALQRLCVQKNKEAVVYLSMGFGNPYGDPYSPEVVIEWTKKLADLGVKTVALADTVGVADDKTISYLFSTLIPEFPSLKIGAHFHSTPNSWEEKVQSAYDAGCRRFDSAFKGIGGCPMAKDDLVGNLATENLVAWAQSRRVSPALDGRVFQNALLQASGVFL